MIVLSIGLMALASLGVERAAQLAARRALETDATKSVEALSRLLGTRYEQLQEAVGLALADPLFRGQLSRIRQADDELGLGGSASSRILQDSHQIFASADLPVFRRYPALAVFDERGALLYSKAEPARFGGAPSAIPLVQEALARGTSVALVWPGDPLFSVSGIFRSGGEPALHFALVRAVTRGTQIVGALLVAEPVSDFLLPELEDAFRARAVLETTDRRYAAYSREGTALGSARESWRDLAPGPAAGTFSFRRNDTSYLGISAPLTLAAAGGPIGRVSLFRSLEQELGPFRRRVQAALAVILALAIAASLLLSSRISRRLTGPLRALEQGMRRLQDGDLSVEIAVTSLDEVGFLTRAFNRMTASLREKTEIERLNAKLRGELRAAREIQRSLLPPMRQEFGGATLEALYHPCEELSGDFFDSRRSGDWLYFYVADVTSHGTASAQVTYLLKAIFHRSVETTPAPTLDELVERMSASYVEYRLDYDVGLQAGRYHLQDRTFEYYRCGSPIAVRVSGGALSAFVTASASGLSGWAAERLNIKGFGAVSCRLEPGDRIFLFTDGAYEFEAGANAFGRRALCDLLKTAGAEPGMEWGGRVFNRLSEANRGERFEDDLTIVRLST